VLITHSSHLRDVYILQPLVVMSNRETI